MPRNLPDTFKDALLSAVTSEGIIAFLTAAWDDGTYNGTIRLCTNDEDIVYLSNTYIASSFDMVMPDEDETDIPKMAVAFDDIDLSLRTELRRLRKPAVVTIRLAMLSDVTQTIMSVSGKMRIVDLAETMAQGEIHLHDDLSTAPYPAYRFVRGHGFMSLR